jgi:hypothetical protein
VNPENIRIERKHISNANLAKTEKWLRNQANLGWKLSEVRTNVFYDTFVFIKSTPCDYMYFAPASFAKLPKLQNTSLGVINYIKNTYGGKKISEENLNGWIHIKMNESIDIEDIRKNLQYRENCIMKEYLLYFICFIVSAFAMLSIGLLSDLPLPFYSMPVLVAVISLIPAIKLVVHKINCIKSYSNF